MWRNQGDGTFANVTAEAGVGEARWSVPATFVDIDNDGWLDLISRRGDVGARVVIVGTHSAWPGEMLDLAALETRFSGMIAGHVVVDSKSGSG